MSNLLDSTATATRTSLKDEKIRVLSRHEPCTVDSGTSLFDSIKVMQSATGDCLLVCENRRLVGILTERDILLKVLGKDLDLGQSVDQFMTRDPDTLSLEDTVRKALEMMEKGGYRNVPLLDSNGDVSGLLRAQDVLEYVAESFPQEVLNLPPRPHQTIEQPEGA